MRARRGVRGAGCAHAVRALPLSAVLKKRREAERLELPVSSLDKFFGGQFEWYGSDPKPYDWPHKSSISIVDSPGEPKKARPKPPGHAIYRAPTNFLMQGALAKHADSHRQ